MLSSFKEFNDASQADLRLELKKASMEAKVRRKLCMIHLLEAQILLIFWHNCPSLIDLRTFVWSSIGAHNTGKGIT
jgi:hypothetical protein